MICKIIIKEIRLRARSSRRPVAAIAVAASGKRATTATTTGITKVTKTRISND